MGQAMLLLIVVVLVSLITAAPANDKSNKMKPVSSQICADLCTQGLGGQPCGDACEFDLDKSISSAQQPSFKVMIVGPRRSVCPYLCQYELGTPLCQCQALRVRHDENTVNWQAICDTFCHIEGLSISGCPKCIQDSSKIPMIPLQPYSEFQLMQKPSGIALIKQGFELAGVFNHDGEERATLHQTHGNEEAGWDEDSSNVYQDGDASTDWDLWCEIKCFHGEGGSACNCDALP